MNKVEQSEHFLLPDTVIHQMNDAWERVPLFSTPLRRDLRKESVNGGLGTDEVLLNGS